MNDISAARKNALTQLVLSSTSLSSKSDSAGKPLDTSTAASGALEAVIGKALAAIVEDSNNPLESVEATFAVRLKALSLLSSESSFDDLVASNVSGDQADSDYLDRDRIKDAYKTLYLNEYNALRRPTTPYEVLEDPKTFPESNVEGINVSDEDRLTYHFCDAGFGKIESPSTLESWLIQDEEQVIRYSLNVNITRELIEELDRFILAEIGGLKFSKYPSNRHDSVICYFSNGLSPDREVELAKIIQPYVRGKNLSGEEIKEGDTVFPGITREVNPSEVVVSDLTGDCYDVDPLLLEAIEMEHGETTRMSTGQYLALTNVLEKLKKDLPSAIFELEYS